MRFLDWHGAQTAKLIRAKKKIIALLNEQKQAIIHRAVTRGLDPNAKLKPSGIPWLGDVPEGWEIQRLGRLLDLTAGFAFKSSGFTDADDDIRLFRGHQRVTGKDTIDGDVVVHWPAEDAEVFSGFALRVGDIVVRWPIYFGGGFAGLALLDLLSRDGAFRAEKKPHFDVKAKHVVFLFMNGAPSQIDTFDPKPALDQYDGKALRPQEVTAGRLERPTGRPFDEDRRSRLRNTARAGWKSAASSLTPPSSPTICA